jgi:hypothetical protein
MTATSVNRLGKLGLIDETKRAGALALVKRGRMYDLGRVLDEHAPVFPGRYFKQTLVTTAHHANPGGGVGANEVNWITELVSGTMQLGTHLDALSHLQMGNRGYGGLTVEELADTNGVKHLGIETVTRCCFTPGGAAIGISPRSISRVSPDLDASWLSGWPTATSR